MAVIVAAVLAGSTVGCGGSDDGTEVRGARSGPSPSGQIPPSGAVTDGPTAGTADTPEAPGGPGSPTGGGGPAEGAGQPGTAPGEPPPGGGETSARRPGPTEQRQARPSPKPPRRPSTAAKRVGAPYDIAPFDNIDGPLGNFYDSVAQRCGSPSGGSGCLSVVEIRSDDPDVEECIVRDISYSPPPGPSEAPDSEKKLQRGTKVTVQADCPPESPAEETSES